MKDRLEKGIYKATNKIGKKFKKCSKKLGDNLEKAAYGYGKRIGRKLE
jgi:hypothetical protein